MWVSWADGSVVLVENGGVDYGVTGIMELIGVDVRGMGSVKPT